MRKRWLGCLCLLPLLPMVPVQAAAPAAATSNLEHFIDGVLQRALVRRQTAGATVAVVQDGRLLLARGYGAADLTRGLPVESRVTQFRIGSITKVLIWISVLQLVEAGKLDLDRDINDYLTEFVLPPDFTAAITLRHLMTHTPGFEDNLVGLFVSGPRQVGALADVLAANVPRRIRLPGTLVAYSNYGAALAGHIVEQTAGVSWDEYVEANIFEPLGMSRATTRQPLPDSFEATRARGYIRQDDQWAERGFMYVPMAPAGSASATSLDMARLMVELLNPRSTSILSATSKAQLLGGAYINHPLVNGMTLGMFERAQGPMRAVGHTGNTLLFNSEMVLWPEAKMGLFVSTNSLDGQAVVRDLVDAVSARLGFTEDVDGLEPVNSGTAYVGEYLGARRNHSNFSKVMGLLDSVRVEFDRAEQVLWVADVTGRKQYQKLADHVFGRVGGHERIHFKVDGGTARELFFSDRPNLSYVRAADLEAPSNNLMLLGGWLLLALGVLFVWPLASLVRRDEVAVRGQRLLSVVVYLSVVLICAFFVQVAAAAGNAYELLMTGFSQIESLLWYPLAFMFLVAWQLVSLYRVWSEGFWWLSRRLYFSLLLLGQLGLAGWLWHWNLLPELTRAGF